MLLKSRSDAGKLLADKLLPYRHTPVVVLGLANGGVVTARSIFRVLGGTLDVLVVKKIPSPYDAEFALGAVAPDNVRVIHWKDAQRAGADEEYMSRAVSALSAGIKQRSAYLRKGRKPLAVAEKTVILVDDGAATGATMEAAVLWARKKQARNIVVALPVLEADVAAKLRPEVHALVALAEVSGMRSVGACYESFAQISDQEVIQLLQG